MIKLTECPRDAMQGIHQFIPTATKVRYLNQLLKVGFDILDFGSFVSPKAIPQMRDTAEVLTQLDLSQTKTRLLAIIANQRGAETACQYDEISYLGYPLSISETFQLRNTNKNIKDSLQLLENIQAHCQQYNKTLVTYISMGFGNPYGDPYNSEIVLEFVQKLKALDIRKVSLADTVGLSNPENITFLFKTLVPAFPEIEFGAHLHATPQSTAEKLNAAYQAGCRQFDAALLGFGGCPMAKDDLVGNIATEQLYHFLKDQNEALSIDDTAFQAAFYRAQEVFQGL